MSIIRATGMHAMWGFSPSKNLFPSLTKIEDTNEGPIRILLLEPSDPRHILQTIANYTLKRSSDKEEHCVRPIHFYVVENQMETMARHFLLLHICFDWNIPVRQRAALFLDIYGNLLIQEKSEEYVKKAGKILIDFTCMDFSSAESKEISLNVLKKLFDLSNLKFKERDDLERIFTSWFTSRKKCLVSRDYDIRELRDCRLRNYYGERYDNQKVLLTGITKHKLGKLHQ